MKTQFTYRRFIFTTLSLVLSLLAITISVAQNETIRTLDLKNFDKVSLGSAFNINITKGDFSVKIAGRAEDLDALEASVSGGKLKIQFKQTKGNWWNKERKRIDVTVSMPTVRGLTLSGASRSKVSGFTNLDVLDLEISGASTADIELRANSTKLNLSGASSVVLSGSGERIDGIVSGATSLRAYDFLARDIDLELSGASNARVNATGSLVIEASGASSVKYKGAPSVRSNSSGASSVKSES